MDDDLGSMLQSVLSDPAQMAKISEMAQGLMGGAPQTQTQEPPSAPQEQPFSGTEAKLLSALGRSLGGNGGASRSTALLMAMRPYMKPEKQEKLDRAMKLSQMVRIAQSVMRELGGGHGV